MKKIYIAMAVLATVALTSCVQEQSIDNLTPLGENDIAFYIPGSTSTRAEALSEAEHGITIPVGADNEGNLLYLEETIENLNPKATLTRGTPAYTENVGKLYTTMGVYTDSNNSGDAIFSVMDDAMTENPNGGMGWRYNHQYDGKFNPWEDEDTAADFYLRMPAEQGGVSNLTYSEKKISFDFIPLSTAKDQKDLLYSQITLSKSEHDSYLPKGAPVMMYHALTGVKFRTNSDNSGSTKTIITKVKFTGLKGSGHCVFDGSNFTWTTTTASYTYTQTFTNPDYSEEAWVDGTIGNEGGTAWNSDLIGTSWTAAAADHNLNNSAGELTFWFIPQEITSAVKLEVTFCIKTPDTSGSTGGGEFTHQIDLGSLINKDRETPVKWEAGQLRTYTLDPKDVDVEIFDTMSGKSKTNLHVTNTGNVAEYVRMLVIGNWYGWESEEDQASGKEPDILVGYKTDGSGGENDNEMADPWFRETPKYGQYFDDSFKNGKLSDDNKWLRGTTGFYYPDPIGPGTVMDSQTEALFKSYIWPEDVPFPTIYIPDPNSNVRKPAVGVHLIMEVSVQAISAKKPDGTLYTSDDVWEAWTAAIYPNGGGTIGPK